MNTSIPPFAIGQRVVAVKDELDGDFKKGDEFSVAAIDQCPKCKTWYIDIGRREAHSDEYKDLCGICETIIAVCKTDIIWYIHSFFAPIHSNFQSITLSKILEEESKLISVN